MTKLRRFFRKLGGHLCSLRIRLLVWILVGCALAMGTYLLTQSIIHLYIDTNFTTEESREKRENNYVKDLQSYITKHNITSEDLAKISDWVQSNRFVYLLIYKDDELIFRPDEEKEPTGAPDSEDTGSSESDQPSTDTPEEGEQPDDSSESEGDISAGDSEPPNSDEGSADGDTAQDNSTENDSDTDKENTENGTTDSGNAGNSGGITIDYPTREELFAYAQQNNLHPLEVSDGTLFCSIAEFTEYFYYDLSNILSMLMAMLSLALILILYFQRITSRITRLAGDVATVSHVDRNHRIRPDKTRDEISKLSANVENMRSSLVRTLEAERSAVTANNELITSMSHDLRTPLTVLLGYLDMMKLEATDETMKQYVCASEQTALRLKKLSDDMFAYFLVFSEAEMETTLTDYDAATLLEQMLAEHIVLLTEQGYTLEPILTENTLKNRPSIHTDAPKLMRIIDNLFSNLMKYADIMMPIRILIEEKEMSVGLTIENSIRFDADLAESTGIGLKTCVRIARALRADFETEEKDGIFTARLSLPKSAVNEKSL